MLNKFLPLSVLAQADKINLTQKNGVATKSLENLSPASVISGGISLIMTVVAIAFFVMLVLGGLKWVVSEGDKNNVEGARNQVTNALIGLAIVFSAWAALRLINIVFGVQILDGLTIPSLQGN